MELEARLINPVERSIQYLESSAARDSLRIDPYWPKWDSPWWHAAVLFEMGLGARIPRSFTDAFVDAINAHYLKLFPVRAEEIPPGTDTRHDILCHCALGSVFQIVHAAGVDPDQAFAWARPWFLRYQLPDGGLNCDESTYVQPEPHSSVLSTLPVLEAVLRCTSRPFTPEEEAFLDRGARYLTVRKLLRSARTGELISKDWLRPCFPRFYEYDALRGLSFITEWALTLRRPLSPEVVQESVENLEKNAAGGLIKPRRLGYVEEKNFIRGDDLSWTSAPPSLFDLLVHVSTVNRPCPFLDRSWLEAKTRLVRLRDQGLLG